MSVYILARKDKLFYHFGVLVNDDKVIHFASKTNNMFAGDQIVRVDQIEDFAIGREIKKVYEILEHSSDEIINRAKEYWGNSKKYSLNSNNCILFILWCLKVSESRNFITVVKYYLIYRFKMYNV